MGICFKTVIEGKYRSTVSNDRWTRGRVDRWNTHARSPRLNPHLAWRPRGVLINLRRCQFVCRWGAVATGRIEARQNRFGKFGCLPTLMPITRSCGPYHLVTAPTHRVVRTLLGDSPHLSSNLARGDAPLPIFHILSTCGFTSRLFTAKCSCENLG